MPGVSGFAAKRATSQRYSKGNVAIFAQDVGSLRDVLPTPRSEIAEAMCALFIGSNTVPTVDNIRQLGPVLVSKTRVETMIKFLLQENAFYSVSDCTFSSENLNNLLGPEWVGCDTGVPGESYADRGTAARRATEPVAPGSIVMDAVGYTVGDRSPEDYRKMKASAVAWCLDKNNFLQMQSSSTFMTDVNPAAPGEVDGPKRGTGMLPEPKEKT
ncbi:hypothetical protein B0H13DRAFT_1867949 [Mycena leptocephala]|nr:hypothetical protein B0H13DRAFT_1867949 [Mycena leptocephala]